MDENAAIDLDLLDQQDFDSEPCRIYEAYEPARPGKSLYLSVTASRDGQLRQDIASGATPMQLRRVVMETRDEHLARQISDIQV